VLEQITQHARVGVKGPQAAAWLQQRGIAIPDRANAWSPLSEDKEQRDIVARLGATEFFLEHSNPRSLQALQQELAAAPISGVYPVLREDHAFVLAGTAADAALAEVCNMNFSALRAETREAVMTMMIGVAVIVVPQGNAAQRRYRIWCDPSYGDYLWSSLQDVVRGHA
jgi:sarcosine oxidase subunit gamma